MEVVPALIIAAVHGPPFEVIWHRISITSELPVSSYVGSEKCIVDGPWVKEKLEGMPQLSGSRVAGQFSE